MVLCWITYRFGLFFAGICFRHQPCPFERKRRGFHEKRGQFQEASKARNHFQQTHQKLSAKSWVVNIFLKYNYILAFPVQLLVFSTCVGVATVVVSLGNHCWRIRRSTSFHPLFSPPKPASISRCSTFTGTAHNQCQPSSQDVIRWGSTIALYPPFPLFV